MSHPTRQSVLFEDTFSKPIQVAFDTDLQSSDGGGILLGAVDRKLGLTRAIASFFRDQRHVGKTRHSFLELLRQGVYSRALGYADGNDAAILGGDPVLQTLCDRTPGEHSRLGSQPTLSRFEHAVTRHDLFNAMVGFEQQIISSLKRKYRKAKLITIDLDGTHDPTHGTQQLSLFNNFYRCHCYLPLLGFLSVDGDAEQWLFHARLRSGNARQVQSVIPLLRRVIPKLKKAFPRAQIRVRFDGGFATPRLMAALEGQRVQYLLGMPRNDVLTREVEDLQGHVVAMAELGEESYREYDSFLYQARSWPRARRVVAKVEAVVAPGKEVKRNPRFVVTNLVQHKAETVYAIYCGRGDSENRIKELKDDLEIDRTSCTGFRANAFRVLQTAVAYALFQEMRWQLRDTSLGRCQVGTLRVRLLKIGVRLVESTRRIVMHAPKHWPWLGDWLQAARLVGAVPT